MKITVGNNIKRLRAEKGITQEQLSEAMNVTCAAVSKWERGETYPDITMLQPLAFYFGVSIDELMGYDTERVNEEIETILAEYRKANSWEEANKMIKAAYKAYPNDFRIMYRYMWSLGVSDAEPDLKIALEKKDEISRLCNKIIDGCSDLDLCLGAWKMRAILLHAEGNTDEALRIHSEKFGNWYFSTGQMNEQLFTKDRPEFLYWAERNMYELAEYAADKYVKKNFYDENVTYDQLIKTTEKIADGLYKLGEETGEAFLVLQAHVIFERLGTDLTARENRAAKEDDIIRITDKNLSAVATLAKLAKNNAPLNDAILKRFETDDLPAYKIDRLLSWKNPGNIKLLENKAYRSMLESHKK